MFSSKHTSIEKNKDRDTSTEQQVYQCKIKTISSKDDGMNKGPY